MIEEPSASKRATIVAWEPYKSIPTAFIRVPLGNDVREYNQWSNEFFRVMEPLLTREIVSRKTLPSEIEKSYVEEHISNAEDAFTRLLWELHKNSGVHGNKRHVPDGQDELIAGPRYISVAKFIYSNKNELERRIRGFPELQIYFQRYGGKSRFAEISLGDVGMGVIDRFASKVHVPRPRCSEEATVLLNRIIRERLSSERRPDAGLGFKRALAAVRTLNAFLTIRTNRVWAHYSKQTSPDALELRAVRADVDLANVTGTHYGILVPLSK
jgi:hypothetical protein